MFLGLAVAFVKTCLSLKPNQQTYQVKLAQITDTFGRKFIWCVVYKLGNGISIEIQNVEYESHGFVADN